MAQVCKKSVILRGDHPAGIRFAFGNGNVHEVFVENFTEEVQEAALVHGFSQKLGDSYSGSGGDADTAETMFLTQLEILKSGWTKGERGAGGLADEDLAQALATLTGKGIDEAREAVRGADKEWKQARRKHPAVAAEIAKIKAARAEAKVESLDGTEDLL